MLIGLQPGFEGKERPAVPAASSVNRGWDLIWPSLMAQTIKNPPANARDVRVAALIPGSGRSPGEGNSNPLWNSCLERSLAVYSPWDCKELDTIEAT